MYKSVSSVKLWIHRNLYNDSAYTHRFTHSIKIGSCNFYKRCKRLFRENATEYQNLELFLKQWESRDVEIERYEFSHVDLQVPHFTRLRVSSSPERYLSLLNFTFYYLIIVPNIEERNRSSHTCSPIWFYENYVLPCIVELSSKTRFSCGHNWESDEKVDEISLLLSLFLFSTSVHFENFTRGYRWIRL